MTVIFKDFLQSGRFGSIMLGTLREEVFRVLGKPEAQTDRRRKPELWKYGDLQIGFLNNLVCFIGLYYLNDKVTLPPALEIHGYSPYRRMRIDDFEEYLTAEGLRFRPNPTLTSDEQVCLIVEKGIQVIFLESMLYSIQLAMENIG